MINFNPPVLGQRQNLNVDYCIHVKFPEIDANTVFV